MSDRLSRDYFKALSRRHIFNRYRTDMRWYASAVYMSFGIVDYIYRPDLAPKWWLLRLAFVVYVWSTFALLARRAALRHRIEIFAIGSIVAACLPISYMIHESGGYLSLYVPGLILCSITGVQIFKLNRYQSAITQAIAYFPTLGMLLSTIGTDDAKTGLISGSFLLGMVLLSWIYGSSNERVDRAWARSRAETKTELERLQKTEFLKNHFPQHIREEIEKGVLQLDKQSLISDAVVGFADIISSTRISNNVDLFTDWELKERFLEAATKRATQSGMVVLTHLGDGFLFLVNYRNSGDWHYSLISFFENLASDFQKILNSMIHKLGPIESGVKFGVTLGPTIVGWMGNSQSYFTAMGPDVNLAARLCAVAGQNEIVVSERVWKTLKGVIHGWDTKSKLYSQLKGFDQEVSAVHIRPRLVAKKIRLCEICQSEMSVVRTSDGFIDLQCLNHHDERHRVS